MSILITRSSFRQDKTGSYKNVLEMFIEKPDKLSASLPFMYLWT